MIFLLNLNTLQTIERQMSRSNNRKLFTWIDPSSMHEFEVKLPGDVPKETSSMTLLLAYLTLIPQYIYTRYFSFLYKYSFVKIK